MEVTVALPTKLEDVESLVIKAVLELKSGNRTHTAQALGIGIRTLQRKLKKLGLSDYLLKTRAPKDESAA
jgi:DNA-binding NtrC family response regulator